MQINSPSGTISETTNFRCEVEHDYKIYQAWFKIFRGDVPPNSLPANYWIPENQSGLNVAEFTEQPTIGQSGTKWIAYFNTNQNYNPGDTFTLVAWIAEDSCSILKDRSCFAIAQMSADPKIPPVA